MMGVAGGLYRLRLLSLLLTATHLYVPLAINGQQQVGVSLRLQGVTLSSESLVDVDDILQTPSTNPTNGDESHDQSLLCLTDLEDCCDVPRTRRGAWYYPDGTVVTFNSEGNTFRRNRGPNAVVSDRQFYGSVRLFRQGSPPERGRFRCELPNAANPFVNDTVYANILDIGAVSITPSGSSTAGGNSTLVCSATISTQPDTPPLHFQWFFGPNNNSLPFRPPMTTNSGNNYYTSVLQLSPLSQSHAGMYTCRLGGNARLAARTTLIVNAPPITVRVIANRLSTQLMVGLTGYSLTCDVFGASNLNPTIIYLWTRSDGMTQIQGGSSKTLSLSPLRLSHAGSYSCNVTFSSTLLNNDISVPADTAQSVVIQIPDPQSVTVTSSCGTAIMIGISDVTVNCIVALSQVVMESELSLLLVDAQLSRDGAPIALSGPTVNGTTFTYTAMVNLFGRNDSGSYTCTATLRPLPTSTFLTGMGRMSNTTKITITKDPQNEPVFTSTTCISQVAIGVVATILIESLLALPVIVVILTICWKRRKVSRKNTRDGSGMTPAIYEEPELLGVATMATDQPGNFELMKCPAYMPTTNQVQPTQDSEYETVRDS